MKLSSQAQQQADFSKSCYLQGLCNTKEYMKAIRQIYIDEANRQCDALIHEGFSPLGAMKNIYGLDKGENIL